jgi:hypothetical protein
VKGGSLKDVGGAAAVAAFERLFLITVDKEFERPFVLPALLGWFPNLISGSECIPLMHCSLSILPFYFILGLHPMISKTQSD